MKNQFLYWYFNPKRSTLSLHKYGPHCKDYKSNTKEDLDKFINLITGGDSSDRWYAENDIPSFLLNSLHWTQNY